MTETWIGRVVRKSIETLPPEKVYSLLRSCIFSYRRKSQELVSLLRRPRGPLGFGIQGDIVALPSSTKLGVVVQGPIVPVDTIETLRIYTCSRDIGCIVPSTWDDAPPNEIAAARKLGVQVVLSPRPADPGNWNLNLQVASTMAGLHVLRNAGCTHALKTRTDQRLLHPNFSSFLLALLDKFPLANGLGQISRIVVSGMNSFTFRPYSLSDMLVFGEISDMFQYWDLPPIVGGPRYTPSDYQNISLRQVLNLTFPEMLLMANLVKSTTGGDLGMSMEDYHDLVQSRFLVIDPEMVEQIWFKTTSELEHCLRRYDGVSAYQNWTFAQWLGLVAYRSIGSTVRCNLDRTNTDGLIIP